MRRLHLLIVFLIAAFALKAQAPSGYYDNANGLTGDQLKQALHDIIDNHTEVSYSAIWNAFKNTDNKGSNVVWDMYSDGASYSYSYSVTNDQCGEYTDEGDCYNREHSWPKNWFDGSENSTPGHDLHHIFPTDGYVNSRRSNFPYGEVQSATYTSQNGSKLGTCKSSLGYSGTVFEPIDEYKGDFARAYFYMSVRYYGEDSNWGSSGMTNKSELEDWAIAMLLNWNEQDPVSQKEINRNNVIYNTYQHNRNPFIDNPDYARQIWDPSWSSTYTIYASANPAIGGDAYILSSSDATVSKDFSAQGYTDGQVISNVSLDTNVSVTFDKGSNNNAPKYYSSGTAIRCYGGNTFVVSSTSGNISKVVLTYSSGEGSNAITTNVGTFSTDTWTGSASSVTFTISGTSGHRRIKAVEVTYSGGSPTPVQYATVASGTTLTLTATPNTGYRFVNWTKGTTVVSTNASFNLTVNENATYKANFELDTYTISVAANPTSAGLAYIGNAPSPSVSTTKYIDFSAQGYTNEQVISSATIDANVSVAFNKGSNSNPPKYFSSGTAIRCYGGNYFTVSSTSGSITEIVLTYGTSDGSNAITTNVGSFSTSTWTGSASSVKFTIGGTSGNRRIKTMTVTYTTGGTDPATQATLAYGSTAELNATPNSGYSFVNWTKGGVSVSTDPAYSFEVTEDASLVANFTTNSVAANTSVELPALTLAEDVAFTINSGGTLTVTGDITQESGSAIIIANGGQLICNNSVYVKMQKSITAWNGSKGWYAIASPVNNQSFADVVNLVNTANNPLHNIYRYDEAEIEWEEYRDNQNIFTSFENGRGYLFRTANTSGMIEFKGDNNVDAFNHDLSYACTNNNYKGFNLIGNPYTQNITWANLTKTNVDTDGYFVLDETGTNQGKWSTVTSESAPIAPMRAFLVQATGDNPSVTFSRTTAKEETRAADNQISLTVCNSQYSDEAYVKFKEGHGLNKIEHRNTEIPMLYVINNDEHFAIANMDNNTKVIDLGFEAKTMGQYKLSLKADGDFATLRLIDKLTGNDVDMLVESEYNFIGTPQDIDSRFVVRMQLSQISNDSENSIFAYQSGNDIIVEGNGELQIFDVMGRLVSIMRVNDVETWNTASVPIGVYIFRLVGDDVKTQKIVVK